MSDFDRGFEIVIGLEGGYSDNPADPGGETKYGISKRSFPDLDIANLTLEQAKEIYLVEYWGKAGCDELVSPLNIYLFDAAVNIGVGTARALLAKSDFDASALLLNRIGYYCDLVNNKETARQFFRGWINRVIKIYRKLN